MKGGAGGLNLMRSFNVDYKLVFLDLSNRLINSVIGFVLNPFKLKAGMAKRADSGIARVTWIYAFITSTR